VQLVILLLLLRSLRLLPAVVFAVMFTVLVKTLEVHIDNSNRGWYQPVLFLL